MQHMKKVRFALHDYKVKRDRKRFNIKFEKAIQVFEISEQNKNYDETMI